MILENIHQAAKPSAAKAPSYHAPSHQPLIPLSSNPIPHRTFMHRSRVRPASTTNLLSSISVENESCEDSEQVLSQTDSSVDEVVLVMHSIVGNESMNAHASASSCSNNDVR